MNNTPQLGYFLKYRFWRNSLDLLNYQLQLKQSNRHFNTFSMFYYEKIGKSIKKLKTKKYFKVKVANNLFYGLEKEFAVFSYNIPKSNLGLRHYKFFTYPMRAVYYAIGLYLLQLSEDLIRGYKTNYSHIYSGYGGRLILDSQSRDLKLSYDSVWYKSHYKDFRRRVRDELKADLDDKIVIHLDIQNYFDEISIPILLNLLDVYVKPSIKKELRYDPITQSQITSFFEFMANSKSGIPQSDVNIISGFIGYLYLVFGDLFLDQELIRENADVKSHGIIRYMDDIYISITFHQTVNTSARERYINSLASRIADCLYEQLGLRLNTKTKLYWLNKKEDRDDLIRNLKKVSPGHQVDDEEDDRHPNNKLKNIFRQLKNLKNEPIDSSFKQRRSLDEEILKEVYDERVLQLLKKPENKRMLRKIFTGFNFDLVNAQPRPIIILLLEVQSATKNFEKFLLEKVYLTSRDVNLILMYLCQTEFKSNELTNSLKRSNQMQQVIKVYNNGKLSTKKPGYYTLTSEQTLKLTGMANVIEQIRLRVLSEKKGDYSVALNHLLNEIHSICFRLDGRGIDEKKYDVNSVVEHLVSQKVPHGTCIKIRNLFDRRNKNPVSHADPIAWVVSEMEYQDYQSHVKVCLQYIL